MRGPLAALALCLVGTGAMAQQTWGNLDALLYAHLTSSGKAEASYWLPDSADPALANRAIGVVYEHIPGSAGSVSIATGAFVKGPNGWQFVGPVQGLFGHSPVDTAYGPVHVELTTLMPGPNDARCCPTKLTRWRIDLNSLQARALN